MPRGIPGTDNNKKTKTQVANLRTALANSEAEKNKLQNEKKKLQKILKTALELD